MHNRRRRGGCEPATHRADVAYPRKIVVVSDIEPIWYVAYGSNCLAARFEAYLTGGHATGATRPERGARDTRLPAATAAHWLPNGVRFLGNSSKWGGGGVAFLDHRRDRVSPGRRYLISRGQFDDLAAQESGRDPTPLPYEDLVPGEIHVIGTRWYDGLLAFEPIEGVPAVTFTSPEPPDDREPTVPSAAYLGTILRGLMEVHTMPTTDLASHLVETPGVAAGWTPSEILGLVEK
jgi:hypothetical protein